MARLFSQMEEPLPMGTVDPLDLQPRPPSYVDQLNTTSFGDKIDGIIHRCVRPYVPPGLRIQYCVVPEEVELGESDKWDSTAILQWLQQQFEGEWPPWPDRQRQTTLSSFNNQFWSISMDRLVDDTDMVTALVGLRLDQLPGTRWSEVEVKLLGFTHQRDVLCIALAECLPKGSREKPSDPPELFSRFLVPKRQFSISKRTAAMLMDDISIDVDSGDVDYRGVMYNGSEQEDGGFDGDGYDDDGYLYSGSYCEYKDRKTGKVYSNYAGGEIVDDAPPPPPAPKPKVLGSWEQCKLHWKSMGGLQNRGYRGHGWYYLPPSVGEGSEGLPMLPDESYSVGMFTLVERLMRRISFLWRLDEWLSDQDKDPAEVFGEALRFDSLELFVQDRYVSELWCLAAVINSDWIRRLARAEGMMACLYFNWLDREEEKMRMLRCNEVYSKAFEGRSSSSSFYMRLRGSLADMMRGSVKATIADKLNEYVESNVLARCRAWSELMQINDATGEAEALAKCGSLGPTVEDLLPALWGILNEMSGNHPIQVNSSTAEEGEASDDQQQRQPSASTTIVDFCV